MDELTVTFNLTAPNVKSWRVENNQIQIVLEAPAYSGPDLTPGSDESWYYHLQRIFGELEELIER